MKDHERYMFRCIELGRLGLGYASPNPMVGCVLVHQGKIIGEGYHHQAGEPHAEVNAIHSIKDPSLLTDSTLYVNLEPCAHYGKTPPCAQFIVQHHIPRVVIGNVDPHEKVAGKGIEILKNGGCEVLTGILENEGRRLNRRFFCYHEKKRPFIILKWAQTMDGFIDRLRQPDEKPQPNWITGETARMLVHKWRSEEDAIMVGTKTAIMDNPKLNVREWHGKNPVRVLIDKTGKIGDAYHLLNDEIPTYIFTENKSLSKVRTHFIQLPFDDQLLHHILGFLYQQNIQSVFVEGGSALIHSFIRAGLWDEARVFIGQKEFISGIHAPVIKKHSTKTIKINQDIVKYYVNF